MKMSDSDRSAGSRTESNNSDIKIIRSEVKKHRLKRKGNLLQINPTESELKYRKNFEKLNVVDDLYDWIHCTKCQVGFKQDILDGKKIHSHPLLKVLMCEKCCEFYGDGEFSLDEDDEDKYCRWCGEGGKLFLCSKCICGFCPNCIKTHFGSKKVTEIKKDDDWVCYLCDPEPLWKLRTICQLAQKEAESNRIQNKKDVSEPMKRVSGKREKKSYQKHDVVSSRQYDKDTSNNSAAFEGQRSIRYSRRSYRQQQHTKSEGDVSSSMSTSNEEPPFKRRKVKEESEKGGSDFISGKKQSVSESSSMLTDDDVELTEDNALDDGEEIQNIVNNIHAEKLKEILKLAEITSKLCFKVCKKEFRKLDKKNFTVSNQKLLANCENIKSVVILMSSSLSTVHNLIISLQKKFGKSGFDGMFGGGDDTLMKAIKHILMDKRVKTSHLVSILNDILNRYPFIELGASLIRDSICENTKFIEYEHSDIFREVSVNSQRGQERNVTANDRLNNNLDGTGNREFGFPRGTSCVERFWNDSDMSTDLFDSDRNDCQTSNNAQLISDFAGDGGAPVRRESASDFDVDMMMKMDENLLKLKEKLLQDSSEESSPSVSEISDSSTTEKSEPQRGVKRRGLKENGRTQRKKLSKEERELNRLMNLRSLERRRTQDSTTDFEESEYQGKRETGQRKRNANEEQPSSDDISCKSINEDQSISEVHPPNPSSETDFLKQCLSLVKESVLETTSSDLEETENLVKERAPRRYKYKLRKRNRSNWQDDLPDTSSDDRSDEEDTRRRVKKNSSNTSGESSAESFKQLKRRKRKSKIIVTTDSDSSCTSIEKRGKGNMESPGKGRRSIRKILKKGSLQLETRQAIKVENERKKRIVERNELYKKFFPDMSTSDRLVLDFDLGTGEVLLEVPKEIVKSLKPHQREGIKFMWDNCFESLTSLEESSGSGCILAHCMGLGKTLQVIALIATLISNNLGVNTVLILCPLNVVNNWINEFKLWLKDVDIDMDVYSVIKYKNSYERYTQIGQWNSEGGILVLGYDMLRVLTRVNKKSKPEGARQRIVEYLLDPGPDLVVCDEGHVMKNEDTSLARTVRCIKTSRRIILTGTPFQNNLLEYHSMVQFIKPNILGTRKEFMNRFANPIRNGQFEDSTAADVKLMRARAHVLHKLLDGCIQRFSYSVLTPFLPEKHEYVISIRLTSTQAELYRYYVDESKKILINEKAAKLFTDFHRLQKIWTHPKLVRSSMEEHGTSTDDEGSSLSDESVICIDRDSSENAYWRTVVKPEEYEDIRSSGKLLILFDILSWCRRVGDKVLVFSQSLKNLDLIEYFLHKVHVANSSNGNGSGIPSEYLDTWIGGEDYFRMDGSTGSDMRSKWCEWFNNKRNFRARLFLISTKAGGLGINLIGANRVVVFDASWNPSHDVQSIFRVYRFGQLKPCFIYRLVAEATMEEKIYERQVTKLSLEKRVLDEHQIERHYTMGNLQELYKFDPLPSHKWPVPTVPKDVILAEILKVRRDVIVTYHEHDSLLENKEEEELTEEERKAAWDDFEKEKFMFEQQLGKRSFSVQGNGASMDQLTRDVLRITGMYRASDVPFFTPSLAHNSSVNLPFRIINVQSLDRNFSTASTSQGTSFRNIA